MRRHAPTWTALLLPLLLCGCITNVSVPLDKDLHDTTLGDKVGESTFHSVLALFAWGDAGTQAAARDGGITVLTHADKRIFSVFGFIYYRQTTVVYGR